MLKKLICEVNNLLVLEVII